MRLDPLPVATAEELLVALLGSDASLQALKRLLIERTDGNPFFLEESVRDFVETGVLAGERGAFRLASSFETSQVPAMVQTVLTARIDRLAPEDKRLLQSAAVIGKDVPHLLLQAVAELSEDALRQGLARLQAAEFLYETSLFPDLEYTFKHALTHEVAYGSLLHERRRALHTRIVAAIEALYPDRLAEHVERLAHHALLSEVWDKAVGYLRQAGTKATRRAAYREAVASFEQALEALAHQPDGRGTREQAIDLRFDLRNALWPLGEMGRVHERLQEAETLAATLDDPRRQGWLAVYRTHHAWWTGDYRRAVESGSRALTLAGAVGDLAIRVEANFYLGAAYRILGEHGAAIKRLQENATALVGDVAYERFGQPRLLSASTQTQLAWCLADLGAFAEARAASEQAVRISEAADDVFNLATGHYQLGSVYMEQGDLQRAIPALERGVSIGQARRLAPFLPYMTAALCQAYALADRSAEGVPLLAQAEQQISLTLSGQRALTFARLGRTYLLAGRWADAAARAERALQWAQEHGERGHEAIAMRLLGEIAASADPPDVEQAEAYYRQALAVAEELGTRPLIAHCHLGLGTLYQQVSRREPAHAELATAIDMYRAMEMTFWLVRAERLLATTEADGAR